MTNSLPGRIPIPEIAARLGIGRLAVYRMLEEGKMPGMRVGTGKGRWLVTRPAYEEWERKCGVDNGNRLVTQSSQ